MPLAKIMLVLLGGSSLVAALIVAAVAFSPKPRPAPTAIAAASSARIAYPAATPAVIALPGGRSEQVHSVLNITRRMKYGDWVWNDAGVAAGPVWVRVDLEHQVLSVFRAGHEIGTAVVLYGARDKESPAGTFPVLQKAADYHSITYDAPMPWMLRLTADGVAIHGADVRRGAATHGCIGVPRDFARRLFDAVRIGDPVAILKPSDKS